MVTSRALLFGFIGGCFYLIAVVNALPPLFLALMWLTAGIVVSCFGLALLSLYGLSAGWKLEAKGVAQAAPKLAPAVERDDDGNVISLGGPPERAQPPEESASSDAAVGLTLEVGNAGTFGKSDIVIEVHLRALDPELSTGPDAEGVGNARRRTGRRAGVQGPTIVRRFLIEALPSRARLLTFLPLHDLERGRYSVALVRAVGSDVLGLFRPRKNIPSAQAQARAASSRGGRSLGRRGEKRGEEVESVSETVAEPIVVGPRLVRVGHRSASSALGLGGRGGGMAALAARSDEFGGTRPYVAGDDLRFVHWKSTARRGEMVVREWERAVLHRSLVLWDGAAFPVAPEVAAAADASTSTSTFLSSPASGARLLREGEAGESWRRGVEWSLEIALSLANALAQNGEPCTLWRLDASPSRAEVPNAASLARAAELLADARASRLAPLPEALRTVAGQGGARELSGRAFIVALAPSTSLLAGARRLRGATVVLIDISRLDTARGNRARASAWRGWREALDQGEAQLREAGLRVLRLPLEAASAGERGDEMDVDAWTRDALRALLDERGVGAPGPAVGARN